MLELNFKGFKRGVNQIGYARTLKVVNLSPGLYAREVQNFIYELCQSTALRLYVLAVLAHLLLILHAPRFEKLAEDANRSQRRAKFV